MPATPDPRRSLAVILNPIAGNRRAGQARGDLREALENAGLHFELIPTQYPQHAAQLASEACEHFDAVVAAGGDGTVHEVVTGVHRSGSKALLGVIPLGTGNDFGELIGMPSECHEAVRVLQTASPVTVDLGRVRWREREAGPWLDAIFLNAVGIGFDAMVASEAVRFKRFRGKSAYLAGILSALAKWPNPTIRIERVGPSLRLLPDGRTEPAEAGPLLHEGELFLAGVGNGRTVGGGFTLTPHAIATDGLFDLCFVARVSKWRLPILIPKVIRGTHLPEPEVLSERVSGLRITSPDYGLPLHFDGEVLTRSAVELEVSVLPGAVRVLCPNGQLPALSVTGSQAGPDGAA